MVGVLCFARDHFSPGRQNLDLGHLEENMILVIFFLVLFAAAHAFHDRSGMLKAR